MNEEPIVPQPNHLQFEPLPPEPKKPKFSKKIWISCAIVILVLAGAVGWWLYPKPAAQTAASTTQAPTVAKSPGENIPTLSSSDLKLDTSKNYGDKYANGVVPVGDGKYVTSAPQKGYIYTCHAPQVGGGGAGNRGPWFTTNNTEYNTKSKVSVAGSISWQSTYSMTISGSSRTISTNGLPNGHTTGVFPIQANDAAYRYDRNPNSIGAQSLTYTLAAYPTVGSNNCVGGEAGVMTTGVPLFDGFDAGGRDAGAWEVQDTCGGHPQKTHEYHYHTLSNCIKDIGAGNVIGFALDGFPITGPKVGDGNYLTTADLDECHGITSTITLDGKKAISYHYVMTQDFPYSVSCFKAQPSRPPGQP